MCIRDSYYCDIFLFLESNNDNVVMRQIGILLLCCISLLSSGAQTVPNLYRAVDQEKMNHWVDSVFDAMSYDERIGQLFMVIANPKSDNRNMQRLMRYVNDIKIGGILFHKGDVYKRQDRILILQNGNSLRIQLRRHPCRMRRVQTFR